MVMARTVIKNSTTGRSLMRAAFQVAGALVPSAAEEAAATLFLRTSRLRRPPPAPEGIASHRFEVAFQGGPLAAWDFGQGPTVMLAHGWNGSARDLEAFIAPLVARGFYVVAWDGPGHGESPGSSSSIPLLADAILAVGRRVGPVHAIIAHSLGASAATLALSRGLGASRAALLAPAGELAFYPRAFARGLGLEARTDGVARAIERRVGVPMGSIEPIELARSLRAGALVVHDPVDRETPFEHARSLVRAWPGAELLSVAGLGHRRLLRDPEVVRAVVAHVDDRAAAAEQAASGG
jgi:pimeloyl-ACP methyl ester carboxylesterase